MSARYVIRVLERDTLPDAAALCAASYEEERAASPLLPALLLGGTAAGEVARRIEGCLRNGCVAAFDGARLAGYMGVSAFFPFKGQDAALVGEWAHARAGGDGALLYQSLYAALGELLQGRGTRLHIVAHFAHDRALNDALFDLGFGTFLMEELRDLSPVPGAARADIVREEDFQRIEELESEHARYYMGSPIFLMKDASPHAVRAALAEQQAEGNALFVYREEGEPAGYFMVGRCAGEDMGRLLRGSSTAQVLSAYCRPRARGRNIGKALLGACVGWARSGGYERLFVDHESANVIGSRFWGAHFSPYLRFSMRYVETA
jgi:ribosomal protein S18 acetylase RimI-like enzyme